jgi:hypothetical protein
MTAPGAIFTDEMFRKEDYHPSEIMRAVYEKNFTLTSLRHIFVLDIENSDTRGLIKKKIYTGANSLSYPDPEQPGRVWERGTPEYQALLGTEIGKVMACFVLGAFGQGNRRISRIVSWALPGSPYLELDIEKIDRGASGQRSSVATGLQSGHGDSKSSMSNDSEVPENECASKGQTFDGANS